MTLDKFLLEKSIHWTYVKLDLGIDLIKEYIDEKDINRRRELTLEFFKILHKRYFLRFSNSHQFLMNLKKFEEDFLYKYLYYRDHLIHSFQIFLLGCYIVERANVESLPIDFFSNMNRFLRTWFLISFYHDIGYMVEKLIDLGIEIQKTYFERIGGIKLSEIKLTISDELDKIFKDYMKILTEGIIIGENNKFILEKNNDIEEQKKIIYNELLENYKMRDHGIMSSLFLYYTIYLDIDSLHDETLKVQYLQELNIACCAIAIHSIEKQRKIYINFMKNPFGCLLILCDNIQEWNRPRLKGLKLYELDLWESLEIEVDTDNKCYKFFFKLYDSFSKEDIEALVKNYFPELERIFLSTFVQGNNFLFSLKKDSFEWKLTAFYDESSRIYQINYSL